MSEYPKGSTARQYHDMDGNPVTLRQLARLEPEWVVSRITVTEDYEYHKDRSEQLEQAQARIAELEDLVSSGAKWR